jgi:hypothetical protein
MKVQEAISKFKVISHKERIRQFLVTVPDEVFYVDDLPPSLKSSNMSQLCEFTMLIPGTSRRIFGSPPALEKFRREWEKADANTRSRT